MTFSIHARNAVVHDLPEPQLFEATIQLVFYDASHPLAERVAHVVIPCID